MPKNPKNQNLNQRTDSRSRIKSDRLTKLHDQIRRAPLTPVHQRNTVYSQTRLQLDANFRSQRKSNRPTRIQHTICKRDDMNCGGAKINQKGKNTRLEGHTPSKHHKHLNKSQRQRKWTRIT